MKKIIGHVPLFIVICLMLSALYTVTTSDIDFSYEHYIGLIAIVASVITFFIKPTLSKVITGITLILGTFTVAAFTPVIKYQRIGFSNASFSVDIKIQVYCLLLLLLFFILNAPLLLQFFKKRKL